jgi:hypothetical protein
VHPSRKARQFLALLRIEGDVEPLHTRGVHVSARNV